MQLGNEQRKARDSILWLNDWRQKSYQIYPSLKSSQIMQA
ncbi:hypothetical protein FDUTEX481_00496 [Tolypothrix sp. PCC 7601]|nr:hypothetical protein FDUTEX481_00496 [Tolypothrix sp. PCC 7601]